MKNHLHFFIFIVGLLCLVEFALAQSVQAPNGTQIQFVKAKGTGCMNGQVSVSISPDGQEFSVLMDNYIAETTTNLNLDYKSCILEVGIAAPVGWSYSLVSADYRGFAHAEAGTQVSHQVLYSFDGSKPINEKPGFADAPGRYSFKQQVFSGPFTDGYFIRNQIDSRTSLWSPCSMGAAQPLIIQTYLMARSLKRSGLAQITLDSVDGVIAQQFKWSWKQCSGQGRLPAPQPPPPVRRPPRFGGR